MPTLDAHALLDLYEHAHAMHPALRAVAVAAASPSAPSPEELLAEPLGARDARLWALRREQWGDAATGAATCPACGEPAEVPLDAGELLAAYRAPAERGVHHPRAATTADLLAVREAEDPERALATRCGVPETTPIAEASDALEAVDPFAEVLLDLACPECGHEWLAPLDAGAFVWEEITAAAGRLLRDVDVLARAYGWSEAEVLRLSPARRSCYVEMAGA